MSLGWIWLLVLAAWLAALACARRAPRGWRAATLTMCGLALGAAVAALITGNDWEWRSTFLVNGEPLLLRLDALSAVFLALVSVLGGAGAVYAGAYWPDARHPRSAPAGRVWWVVFLGGMIAVLLAANGWQFLVAWEWFAVSGWFLLTLEGWRRPVREAGWLYLAASHVGTLCLFAFFGLLAARTGSWELGPLRDRPELAPLFWLALAGFGLKAGLFPLHVWLPSAHANAPSHVSAIFSGAAIKLGIYGLMRHSGWLPGTEAAGWVVLTLGLASAVLGVAFALGQHDLKRLLAYHSVENIGIILIGLGFAMLGKAHGHAHWGQLALAGGLLHVWNHGLFKALLFLGAGSVLHATGTRTMSRLGGLWRTMPWTAGCFTLGAVAIAGLPPLNGFVSEWLIYLSLFDAVAGRGPAVWAAAPAAILLGITGALALACFVKVCGVVFLGLPRTQAAAQAHECGPAMRRPMLALAGLCVAIGLAPLVFWPALAQAVGVWEPAWAGGPAPLSLASLSGLHVALASLAVLAGAGLWRVVHRNGVTRAVTWDCGYAAPSPRMQYTAGSFAGIITDWFGWILQPHRRRQAPAGVFPARAAHEEHTPETVLEQVVAPVARLVMTVSTLVRQRQHGRVQSYIFYLVLGLLALALMALLGGAP